MRPLLESWGRGERKVEDYPSGSEEPAGADQLLQRDGRHWDKLQA